MAVGELSVLKISVRTLVGATVVRQIRARDSSHYY